MSARVVEPFARRGVCPALSAPMQTGDGLLSRVAFTDEVSPEDLQNLCALTLLHGNGILDITARGGVQFRGLTVESAKALEVDVLALGLPLRQGLAVETSPLAGIDSTAIADTRPIVSRICDAAAALNLHERLAAKMSVLIDGGGHVQMGDLLADIRLKAIDGDFWQLMLGGAEAKALKAGVLRADDAAEVVIELLVHLAEKRPNARGRDLDFEMVLGICGNRLIDRNIGVAATVPAPYGLMRLAADVLAAALAPAFGQISSEALSALCHRASVLGIKSVRPGPAHELFFIGGEAACQALLSHAKKDGFLTGADDPRSSIAVCAGEPACASAFIPTRDLANHAAVECAALLDGSFTLHLSGCGKGCAYPKSSLLAFSGSAEGLAFTFSDRVSDVPDVILPFAEQKAALSRLARLYEKEHKPGENARTLLARLGRQRIVAALRQDDR